MKTVNFEAYATACDQITRARFRNVLDIEFDRRHWKYYMAATLDYGDTDESNAAALAGTVDGEIIA